ncbi:MAG: DNA-processing protein DprA [Gammaproteobacteria bacterium]|nr:DNA-processing protein DprA [Gammaproteobacteria bacterium]
MQTTHDDIIYWLAAVRLPDIGPVRINRWVNYFSSIKKLFAAPAEELQSAGLTPKEIYAVQNPNWRAAEKDLAWSQQSDCHLVTQSDQAYPAFLRELNDAPALLYVQGDVTQLSQPQLAIVGTRNPTPSGKDTAVHFAYSLARAGLVITSGLAIGIDTASHEGALAASAKTIAVIGSGLEQIYPYSNRALAKKIISQGAMVSEFPPDTRPKPQYFPRRNRLISGLSLGVLVVEAAIRSGSLITARFASEQGREVFAIPGSIHNPLARGCHQLLRLGAKLVESTEDILEELGSLYKALSEPPVKPAPAADLSSQMQEMLLHIDYSVTAMDTIIVRSGLTASAVSSMLLSLELRGLVQIVPGGYARSSLSV